MKYILIIILFFLVSGMSIAQDTLVFHSGKTWCVKVLAVEEEVVKYKSCDNSSRRKRRIDQWKIKLIKYSNGKIDSISYIGCRAGKCLAKIQITRPDIQRARFYYEGRGLGEKTFAELIRNYPDIEKRKELLTKYEDYKKSKRGMARNSIIGLTLFVVSAGFFIEAILQYEVTKINQTEPVIAGVALDLVGLGFMYTAGKRAQDRARLKREIVELYNKN